jgi:hypothetical protein
VSTIRRIQAVDGQPDEITLMVALALGDDALLTVLTAPDGQPASDAKGGDAA